MSNSSVRLLDFVGNKGLRRQWVLRQSHSGAGSCSSGTVWHLLHRLPCFPLQKRLASQLPLLHGDFFFLILWQFHTCIYWTMAIFTSVSHVSPSPADILLPNITLRTWGMCACVCVSHWVYLRFLYMSIHGGLFTETWTTFSCYTITINVTISPQCPLTDHSSSVRDGATLTPLWCMTKWCPAQSCAGFRQVSTAAVSSWVWCPCRDQSPVLPHSSSASET